MDYDAGGADVIFAGLPPPTVPVVDPNTGMVTQAWYGFFKGYLVRQGTTASTTTAAVQTITALMRVGGTSVGAHRALMFDPSGAAALANPMDTGFLFAGISQQAGVAGSSISVLQSGPMTEATWAWTPGLPLFAGSNGTLTQTVPLAGVMQEIAIAYTATMVMVQPQTPITLH